MDRGVVSSAAAWSRALRSWATRGVIGSGVCGRGRRSVKSKVVEGAPLDFDTSPLVRAASVTSATGTMLDLGTLGGETSRAHAINNLGWVIGDSDPPNRPSRAFLWIEG